MMVVTKVVRQQQQPKEESSYINDSIDPHAVSSWLEHLEQPAAAPNNNSSNGYPPHPPPDAADNTVPAWATPATTATTIGGGDYDGRVPAWNRTNDNTDTSQQQQPVNNQRDGEGPGKGARVLGASALAATVGALAIGPVAAVVAAGGAAYAAGTQGGLVGGTLRGAGGVVARAGSSAKQSLAAKK